MLHHQTIEKSVIYDREDQNDNVADSEEATCDENQSDVKWKKTKTAVLQTKNIHKKSETYRKHSYDYLK